MKKAYSHFLRAKVNSTSGGFIVDTAQDVLEAVVLSVGKEVKDIKEGMIVEFQYGHSKKVPVKDGVIYYVKDEAIMSYEDNNTK